VFILLFLEIISMDKTKLENLTQGISPKDILRLQDIARDTIL